MVRGNHAERKAISLCGEALESSEVGARPHGVAPSSPILCGAEATGSSRSHNTPDKQVVSIFTSLVTGKSCTRMDSSHAPGCTLEFDAERANSARQHEDFGSRCTNVSTR
jgi:hypothetical protein